jgi:hypothetical protein
MGGVVVLTMMTQLDPRVQSERAAVALLAGAALGAPFGRLMRRLVRVLPRVMVAAILTAAAWLLAYAFVLTRFAPQLAQSLPLEGSMLGALVYGACVGVVPPLRVRYERVRRR